MTFDWFTFVAQIINFLVLVALLKRFLYGPIITAMQKREDEIAASQAEVAEHRRQAVQQTQSYRQKIDTLERRRQEKLDETEQEVNQLRKAMLAEARDTVDRRRDDWMQTVDREKDALARLLRHRACKEVVSTARRALEELADVDLEERIIIRFLERIEQMNEDERREIQAAMSRNGDAVTVRTSFEVAQSLQQRIEKTLAERLQIDRDVNFHTSGDVVCGIELQVSGNKVAWSVDEFLSSMEEELEREVI
jgi:F-type H+-transporting ATPase subunit b